MLATPTRRQLIPILGAAAAATAEGKTAKARTAIHQESDFKVSTNRVYEALLDAKQFAAFTKDAASIELHPGGRFTLFGGRIEGCSIELSPNQRIVQAWREASWPAGLYTLVKFELVPRDSGTRIVFDQTGIAPDDWEHLNVGWPIRYWNPLREYLHG